MIGLDAIYIVAGLMFAAFATSHALDRSNPRRWRSAVFWGCFAVIMIAGSWLPHLVSGLFVLVMALLATIGLKPGKDITTDTATRETSAAKLRDRLFLPALTIPAVTVIGTLLLPLWRIDGVPAIDPKQVTLFSLAIGAIVGLGLALRLLRTNGTTAAHEGRRLVDAMGWAAVLPQMLAALGGIFAIAGVGKVVATLATDYIPMDLPLIAVVVYTTGMAMFTIVMGNAFAAFPVMTAGIGLPLIVGKFGGDPVIMSALGMLSGFCGTLLTPMAANFNIVPAAILELRDRNAVIKVQAPTAFLLLFCNTVMMALFVFHR
ncbi:MAG: DUF979 domain-containing protein [Alphaproteobacteria bacterium]|nr:DUF979 domain-containing protein [Alphaproteobacteria bacterium]MDE1987021.1 DUF979 domain-containing protein [Alphaproteobacteria bacterium]MDE2266089.1 DUF979 domain-containing protein [Alphaproteobacteria bacterium]MDE2499128.1 DUF979 domain-containing protein [Alphaproteobacteria bacterium]